MMTNPPVHCSALENLIRNPPPPLQRISCSYATQPKPRTQRGHLKHLSCTMLLMRHPDIHLLCSFTEHPTTKTPASPEFKNLNHGFQTPSPNHQITRRRRRKRRRRRRRRRSTPLSENHNPFCEVSQLCALFLSRTTITTTAATTTLSYSSPSSPRRWAPRRRRAD